MKYLFIKYVHKPNCTNYIKNFKVSLRQGHAHSHHLAQVWPMVRASLYLSNFFYIFLFFKLRFFIYYFFSIDSLAFSFMENGFPSPRSESFPAGLRVLVVDDGSKFLKRCSRSVLLMVPLTFVTFFFFFFLMSWKDILWVWVCFCCFVDFYGFFC